jgi:hypothetical protein
LNVRQITIRLGDYVEEEKRRERRGGRAVAAAAIVLALAIAMTRGTTPPPTTTDTTSSTASPLTPARLTAAPDALAFPPQLAGTASAAQLVRIRNEGDEAMTIARVAATDGFSLTHDCAGALAKGDSCSAAIVFAPAAPGPRRGELTIETNAETRKIPLQGDARPLPPVDLGPTDLGTVLADAPRPPHAVRFANSGAVAIAFGKPSISPPFTIVGDRCGGQAVPPGGNCEVDVALPPNALGSFKGDLRLVDGHGELVAFSTLTGATTLPPPPPPPAPAKIDIQPRELVFGGNARGVVVTNFSGRPVKIDIGTDGLPGTFVVDTKTCSKVYEANERCFIAVSTRPVFAYVPKTSLRVAVRYEGRVELVPVMLGR